MVRRGRDLSLPRDEPQSRLVDAIAEVGGRGAVAENVAEVGVATAAQDFNAALQLILLGSEGSNILMRDRLPEARPSGAGIVLGIG